MDFSCLLVSSLQKIGLFNMWESGKKHEHTYPIQEQESAVVIHSHKLKCNLKMEVWKMMFLFIEGWFSGSTVTVSFREKNLFNSKTAFIGLIFGRLPYSDLRNMLGAPSSCSKHILPYGSFSWWLSMVESVSSSPKSKPITSSFAVPR